MRRKLTYIGILTILISGLAAAPDGPLKNFDFNPENGFSSSIEAGGTYYSSASFENVANKKLPIVVEITASSKKGMSPSGAEFSFNAELKSENGNETAENQLPCSHVRLKDENTSIYSCSSESLEILSRHRGQPSENNLTVEMKVSRRIAPGRYNFTMDIKSRIGIPAKTELIRIFPEKPKKISLSSGSSSVKVSLNSDSSATAELRLYEKLSAEPPGEDTRFVSGLDVELKPLRRVPGQFLEGEGEFPTEEEPEASGALNISYSQSLVEDKRIDESTLKVYFYNETSRRWSYSGVNVTERNPVENFLVANVSHFSVYAAYGEKRQPPADPDRETGSDEGAGGDGGGISVVSLEEDRNRTEESNETSGQVGDGGEEKENEGASGENPETKGGEEGREEPEQQPSRASTPAGFFARAPTGGLIAGFLLLAAAAAVVLQRKGKIDIAGKIPK